jgi:hypothetical protein
MSNSKAKPKTVRRQPNESGGINSPALRQKIAEAAYYKAERRGFASGQEERDWLEAEKESAG